MSSVVVAIAQVAAGGTIVQGVMAFVRRRSELRQLDSQSDNVAVGTAEHLIIMLRTELDNAKKEMATERSSHKAELEDVHRQIMKLGTDLSAVRAENVVMRAEITRLQGNIS